MSEAETALKEALEQENADVFTVEMLARVADTLPKFDALGKKHPFALFLEPRFGIVLAPAEPIPESFATVGAVCAYLRGWQQAERMQVGAYAGS